MAQLGAVSSHCGTGGVDLPQARDVKTGKRLRGKALETRRGLRAYGWCRTNSVILMVAYKCVVRMVSYAWCHTNGFIRMVPCKWRRSHRTMRSVPYTPCRAHYANHTVPYLSPPPLGLRAKKLAAAMQAVQGAIKSGMALTNRLPQQPPPAPRSIGNARCGVYTEVVELRGALFDPRSSDGDSEWKGWVELTVGGQKRKTGQVR